MAENKPELGNIPPALRDHLIFLREAADPSGDVRHRPLTG